MAIMTIMVLRLLKLMYLILQKAYMQCALLLKSKNRLNNEGNYLFSKVILYLIGRFIKIRLLTN